LTKEEAMSKPVPMRPPFIPILLLSAAAAACSGAPPAGTDAGGADAGPPIRTTDETQYLDFGLPFDGLFDQTDAAGFHAILDDGVADLVAKIGTSGDGQYRQLGFMFVVPPWIVDAAYPGKLPQVVAQAAQVALERGVAFHISIESHYYWATRPDLWNFYDPSQPGYNPANAANVEWSDWQGTPYRWRFIDWGAPQMLDAPHMCYLSAEVRSEVGRLGGMLGNAVQSARAALAQAGHPELFSGITVDSEPSLDNYEVISVADPAMGQLMAADGAPQVRLGYCSFTAMGFSAANPPPNLAAAAAAANQEFIRGWAQAVAGAGVPPGKLYTHIGASAEGTPMLGFTNAPIEIAFIGSARPGWTTYPSANLRDDFAHLTTAPPAHGNPHWGGTESAPFDGAQAVDAYEYLRRHYDAGATLVVMNIGATGGLGGALDQAVYGPAALDAYRRFLTRQ